MEQEKEKKEDVVRYNETWRYFYEWVKEEGERCIEEGLIPQEEVN